MYNDSIKQSVKVRKGSMAAKSKTGGVKSIMNKITISKRFIISIGLVVVTFLFLIFSFYAYYSDVKAYQQLETENSNQLKNDMKFIMESNSKSKNVFLEMQKNSRDAAEFFESLLVLNVLYTQVVMLMNDNPNRDLAKRVADSIDLWLQKPATQNGVVKPFTAALPPLVKELRTNPTSDTASNTIDAFLEITGIMLEFSTEKGKYSLDAMEKLKGELEVINKNVEKNLKNLQVSDQKREKSAEKGKQTVMVVVVTIFVMILLIIFLLYVLKLFSSDIKNLTEYLRFVTKKPGEIDISKEIAMDPNAKDEIAFTTKSLDQIFDNLKTVLEGVKQSAEQNAKSSRDLEHNARGLSDNIKEQFELIDGMQVLVNDVGQNLDKTEEMAIHTTEDLTDTQGVLLAFVRDIEMVIDLISVSSEKQISIADKMKGLTDQASQIKDVLKTISSIAERTNLLALNAAIEAARAGEHGRGFAVVADNVRQLAELTQKSLSDINSTVNIILQGINDNSDEINIIAEDITVVSKKAQDLISTASDTKEKISKTVEVSSEVVHMGTYIAKKTKDLIDIMKLIIELSGKNKSAGEDVLKIADTVENRSKSLGLELQKFKL